MNAAAENPYPGLRPFEADQAHLFFGREAQCDELLSRLGRHRFVAVVGSSGSGKSSLVRAGLLPSLYGGFLVAAGSTWRIALLRPGNDPIGRLAAALDTPGALRDAPPAGPDGAAGPDGTAGGPQVTGADFTAVSLRRGPLGLIEAVRLGGLAPGENLLVVVDQFEELFRFGRPAADSARDDRAAFVRLLLEAVEQSALPIYVVLTLRSDYIGEGSRYPELAAAISDSQFLVPRLTRDQLKAAIEGPAAVGGAGGPGTAVAPRLVQRLLEDVGEDSDQLPLLQHALMRTWERWVAAGRRGPLDLEHYEGAGGTREALSRHADEAFSELDPEGQRIARLLFRTLTEKNDEQRGVRRPTELAEIAAVAAVAATAVAQVAEVFRRPGRSFLMPPAGTPLEGSTVLDISHESLMRVWRRLRGWVDEEGVAGSRWRRLAESARLYAAGEAGLLRQPELAAAEAFWARERPTAAWAERYGGDFAATKDFLAASRRSEGRRTFLKSMVAPVLVSTLLAAVAWQQKRTSQKTIDAQQQEIAALESQRSELQQKVAAAGGGQQQRRAEIELLRGGNAARTAEAGRQKAANAALAARVESLGERNAGLASRAAGLRQEEAELARAIEDLRQRAPLLDGRIGAAQKRRQCLAERLAERRASFEKLRSVAKGLGLGVSFETASMASTGPPRDGDPTFMPVEPGPDAPKNTLRREVSELEALLREIEGEAAAERQELERLRQEQTLLTALLAELRRQAAEQEQEIARLEREAAGLELEIGRLEKSVAEKRREKSRLDGTVAARQKELARLEAAAEEARDELSRLDGESRHLRQATSRALAARYAARAVELDLSAEEKAALALLAYLESAEPEDPAMVLLLAISLDRLVPGTTERIAKLAFAEGLPPSHLDAAQLARELCRSQPKIALGALRKILPAGLRENAGTDPCVRLEADAAAEPPFEEPCP